jgi:prepilin-type N-terminal cleavage/methylation domain-containing protein
MGEDGFTLIELLIVLIILPIVIGGVTVAIITSLQDQQGLSGQLENSSGAQGASAYFVRDVQSATTITAPSLPGCGDNLGTQVLVLQWPSTTVSYEYTSGASGEKALVRSLCVGGTQSNTYLSLDLDPSKPPMVTVTVCPTAATCQQETSGTWTPGGANPIDTVELTATYAGSGSIFSLTATPRKWSAPPGGKPIPQLLVLGSGSSTLSDSANGNVLVNGPLVVNSSSDASIVMSPAGNGNLKTSPNNPIYVADPTPTAAVQNNASRVVNPSPTYSPLTQDPLSNVTPPTQPPAGSCMDVASIDTCSPGVYTAPLPAPDPGDAVTFQSGVYFLQQGMDLSGSGSITETTDASDPSSSGVLFYVTGGAIKFPTENVDITSLLGSPQYPNPDNIIIWQASTTPGDSVTLSSAGGTSSSYSGTVYAPDEEVMFVGTSRLKVTGNVIAQSVSFAQSRRVTIG